MLHHPAALAPEDGLAFVEGSVAKGAETLLLYRQTSIPGRGSSIEARWSHLKHNA
jgi:hypothetical protein